MTANQVSWKILELQSQLISDETDISLETMLESKLWFQPHHYSDVIEERANIRKCGYPLCGKSIKIPNAEQQQYRIDYKNKQIFSIEESRYYCSAKCLEDSLVFKTSLETSNPVTRSIVKSLAHLDEDNAVRVLNVLGIHNEADNHLSSQPTNQNTSQASHAVDSQLDENVSIISTLPPPPSFANSVLSKFGKVETSATTSYNRSQNNMKPAAQPPLFRDSPRKPNQPMVPSRRQSNVNASSSKVTIMKDTIRENVDAVVQPTINLLSSNELSDTSRVPVDKVTSTNTPVAETEAVIVDEKKHASTRPVFHPSLPSTSTALATTSSAKPSNPVLPVISSFVPDITVEQLSGSSYPDDDTPYKAEFIRKPSKSILELLNNKSSSQAHARDVGEVEQASVAWTEPRHEDRPTDAKVYRGHFQSDAEKDAVFTEEDREQYPEWLDKPTGSSLER